MPSKARDIRSFVFQASDQLFLDANIWLRIYGPQKQNDWRVAVYSGGLARMLGAMSSIFADVLVISEFVNSYARLRYNLLRATGAVTGEFKQFRNSPQFKPIAHEICDSVRRILKDCTRTESGFPSCDIVYILSELEKCEADFNDHILASICQAHGWSLVTDDGDFTVGGVSLISANKKLL
jgi:predicted nucleic acid-binding protein